MSDKHRLISDKHRSMNDKLAEQLLLWYWQEKRLLPWRHDRDPYKIWVSEIMLQQTRVEAVKEYYRRFMEQFPTVYDLASASEQAVLKAWEGLGYYSRARHLHQTAQVIVTEYHGEMPREYSLLRKLPGIGEYTAGAIMSIAFNESYAAVDGNALRVVARWHDINEDISKASTKKAIEQYIIASMPDGYASDFNQAIMDLGATICIAKYPRCDVCPVHTVCKAKQLGKQADLPKKTPKKPPEIVYTACIYAVDGRQLLIEQRQGKGLLANTWQLPTAEGENRQAAWEMLQRYLLQIAPDVRLNKEEICREEHIFSHKHWKMSVYSGGLSAGESPSTIENISAVEESMEQYSAGDEQPERHRWIDISDWTSFPISKIYQKIWENLRHRQKSFGEE